MVAKANETNAARCWEIGIATEVDGESVGCLADRDACEGAFELVLY